jgi:hypothetical protein
MYDDSGRKLIDILLRQQGLVPNAGKDQLLVPLRVVQNHDIIAHERLESLQHALAKASFAT